MLYFSTMLKRYFGNKTVVFRVYKRRFDKDKRKNIRFERTNSLWTYCRAKNDVIRWLAQRLTRTSGIRRHASIFHTRGRNETFPTPEKNKNKRAHHFSDITRGPNWKTGVHLTYGLTNLRSRTADGRFGVQLKTKSFSVPRTRTIVVMLAEKTPRVSRNIRIFSVNPNTT